MSYSDYKLDFEIQDFTKTRYNHPFELVIRLSRDGQHRTMNALHAELSARIQEFCPSAEPIFYFTQCIVPFQTYNEALILRLQL